MLGKIVDDMNLVKAGKDSELYKLNIYSGVSFCVHIL